jgi:hypothetical protein
MPLIPIATFLAGALLSLLLPVGLLLALTAWYYLFIRRVPETTEAEKPGPPAGPAAPGGVPGPAGE